MRKQHKSMVSEQTSQCKHKGSAQQNKPKKKNKGLTELHHMHCFKKKKKQKKTRKHGGSVLIKKKL